MRNRRSVAITTGPSALRAAHAPALRQPRPGGRLDIPRTVGIGASRPFANHRREGTNFPITLNDEIRFSVPVVSQHANDNERAALMEFLTDTIERDRFPLSPRVKRLSGVLAVVAMVAMPLLVAAEPLERCDSGQQVTDDVGNPGQIVGGRGGLCLVRSPDGRSQTWVSVNRLSPASPAEPDASADGPKKEAPPPPDGAPPKPSPGEVSKEQNP